MVIWALELAGEPLALFAVAGWLLALLFYAYWRIDAGYAKVCAKGWKRACDGWEASGRRAYDRFVLLAEVKERFPAAAPFIRERMDAKKAEEQPV